MGRIDLEINILNRLFIGFDEFRAIEHRTTLVKGDIFPADWEPEAHQRLVELCKRLQALFTCADEWTYWQLVWFKAIKNLRKKLGEIFKAHDEVLRALESSDEITASEILKSFQCSHRESLNSLLENWDVICELEQDIEKEFTPLRRQLKDLTIHFKACAHSDHAQSHMEKVGWYPSIDLIKRRALMEQHHADARKTVDTFDAFQLAERDFKVRVKQTYTYMYAVMTTYPPLEKMADTLYLVASLKGSTRAIKDAVLHLEDWQHINEGVLPLKALCQSPPFRFS